jgi:Fic family protein
MAHTLNMRRYPRLDQHKIPYKFEYTDKLVRLLMRIAETKPYLEEYLGKPLELQLLRQAKILAITYSNQIEGNKLEVRGVTQILESKKAKHLTKTSSKSGTTAMHWNTLKFWQKKKPNSELQICVIFKN